MFKSVGDVLTIKMEGRIDSVSGSTNEKNRFKKGDFLLVEQLGLGCFEAVRDDF
jgi:hypothetical protein